MKIETPSAFVQQFEDADYELVERAQNALSNCNWTVGECAAKWVKPYSPGRTDADFGEIIGLSQQRVNEARRVYERFKDLPFSGELDWSHFIKALPWDDAYEYLAEAAKDGNTATGMVALRRARNPDSDVQPQSIVKPTPPDFPEGESTLDTETAASAPRVTEAQIEPHVEAVKEPGPAKSKSTEKREWTVDSALKAIRKLRYECNEHLSDGDIEDLRSELEEWIADL